MLGRYVRTLIDRHGADHIFQKFRPHFTDHPYDMVVANLEGPIVINPVYHQSGTTFGFPQDTAKIIQQNHITAVSLANNHILDRSEKGREETKKFLTEAGVEFFDNNNILIKKINGQSFAFIGFHDATKRLDEHAAARLIKKYAADADRVIVSIHWGEEYKKTPNIRQKNLAHLFIDSGADLIIGHHPHVPQTRENYKGAEIFYSLGNFIFDQYWSDATQRGLAVAVEWPSSLSPPILSPPSFIELPLTLYKSIPEFYGIMENFGG